MAASRVMELLPGDIGPTGRPLPAFPTPKVLAEHGPVHPDVAAAMASGVRDRLGATYGLATTGVAGPGPADGHPAGTVFVAVCGQGAASVSCLTLRGSRQNVRDASVAGVLSLLASALQEDIS